jgi:hypothetical protein
MFGVTQIYKDRLVPQNIFPYFRALFAFLIRHVLKLNKLAAKFKCDRKTGTMTSSDESSRIVNHFEIR